MWNKIVSQDKNRNNKKNGFTLMEVIIAIGIVSVGVVALVALLNFTIKNSSISVNRLIATNLAQARIEFIRNDRDQTNNWHSWFMSTGNSDETVKIWYDDTLGIYHPQAGIGTETIFSRRTIINAVSNTEKEITVEISWSDRGKNYFETVSSKLYDWQE